MTNAHAAPRPTTAEGLAELLAQWVPSKAEIAAFRPLEPRPTDVVISPFAKCGTTMLQQMFHQLRTGGDMYFDDICRVLPWIHLAPMMPEIDLSADQVAAPRGYKSHAHYAALPPGMRYLVTLRDPGEAYMSMYHFFDGWLFEPGTISPEQLWDIWARETADRPNYFTHLLSWWDRRESDDTLVMDYRAVIADKRAAIARVASFAGIPADRALVDLVERRIERAYMVAHKDRFDDVLMRRMTHRKSGIPVEAVTAKVRGQSEPRLPLPAEIAERIEEQWAQRIAPATGHDSYGSLARALD